MNDHELGHWSRRQAKKRGSGELEEEAGEGIVMAHSHGPSGFPPGISCVCICEKWGVTKFAFWGLVMMVYLFRIIIWGRRNLERKRSEDPNSYELDNQKQGKRNW